MKGFQPERNAIVAAFQEQEAAVVGHQHLPVILDIFEDLFGAGHIVNLGIGGFDFDNASRWKGDSVKWSFFVRVLELVGGEQPAIWKTRADLLRMDETVDFWFEHATDGIEEISERAVAGSFLDYPARGPHDTQFTEVDFEVLAHDCLK